MRPNVSFAKQLLYAINAGRVWSTVKNGFVIFVLSAGVKLTKLGFTLISNALSAIHPLLNKQDRWQATIMN